MTRFTGKMQKIPAKKTATAPGTAPPADMRAKAAPPLRSDDTAKRALTRISGKVNVQICLDDAAGCVRKKGKNDSNFPYGNHTKQFERFES